jgi:molybdate transport system regulatory protein
MGIGVLWLLQNIYKYRSISKAAKEMGMSYSKAIRILNELERALGEKVIIRNHGGMTV